LCAGRNFGISGNFARRNSYTRFLTHRFLSYNVSTMNRPGSGSVLKIVRWSRVLKNKLRDLSPRAIYTDRATATCRRSYCQLFCGYRVSRGQRDESLRPYSRISRPESLLFLSSSSSTVLTKLSGPRSRPTTSQKIW
jgi:hypothetical protein